MKSNKQDSDEKIMKLMEYFKEILTAITDNINTFKSSSTQNYSTKPPYPTTVVPNNRRDTSMDGGYSTKVGSIWNLKHEISSPKLY